MIKVAAYITSYNRPDMLKEVVSHLQSKNVSCNVYEDGVTHKFRGRRQFWLTWHDMLSHAKTHAASVYIFMPDDFLNLDVDRLLKTAKKYQRQHFVYNIIDDGRKSQWVRMRPRIIDPDTTRVGFTDCGFFTNRITLQRLGFYMNPVPEAWFQSNKSSGVGFQLSIRCKTLGIPCYIPSDSFAFHGDHPSVMHPDERKINPIRSRHKKPRKK